MKELVFDAAFDCIVALNSELPPLGFFIKYFLDVPIVGADGGAVRLFDKGIICDFVVGDLDTFAKANVEKYFSKSTIIHDPDQEINDFEKALNFAKSRNFQNILVIGFQGGELEHTLNNWSILKKFQSELNLCIYENGRYGIPIYFSIELKCKPQELLSLIPQPLVRLKTEGLKWNLNNEILELGKREGARNVATKEKVSIEVLEGSMVMFIDSRLPYCYDK